MYNSSGTRIGSYTYDAWGNCTVSLESSATTAEKRIVRNFNPFRYRGYYYDYDTGLYYLQSRYYNPTTGRFINADGYVSTGTGLLGYNMYAYCGNNPVIYEDRDGCACVVCLDPYGLENPVGNPATRGGALGAGGALLALAMVIVYSYSTQLPDVAVAPAFPERKKREREKAEAEEKEKDIVIPPSSTVIYRYGGTNPGNLTPREKDRYTGLSFSTVPMPGAAVTTIEALNATGVVYAVRDGETHVSVRPIGGTMDDWINAGSSSVWTQAVKSVVTKWDGVS